MYPEGGLTLIPRRGYEEALVKGRRCKGRSSVAGGAFYNREALLSWGARFWKQLSELLADVDPTCAKAQLNVLNATCKPGSVRLYGVENVADGREAENNEASAVAEAFLKRQPRELGGLQGLRVKGTLEVLHGGLWCLDNALGSRGTGVREIGLVDSWTINFARDNNTGKLFAWQKRDEQGKPIPLADDRFFWYAHHASVTNPYGRAVFAAATAETLRAIDFDQDLSDGTHNAAWKRYVYQYSLERFWAIATKPAEQGGLNLPFSRLKTDDGGSPVLDENGQLVYEYPAREFVNGELAAIDLYLGNLEPDDNLTADEAGGVKELEGASFNGLQPIIEHKDFRQIRALDELATTIGRPNSGAQTYTTAEYQLKVNGWEAIQEAVMAPILESINLNYRLLGLPFEARAEYEPIRRADMVQEANAAAINYKTTKAIFMDGGYTYDEFIRKNTGSGPPKDPDENSYDPAKHRGGQTGSTSGSGNSSTADLPQAGTSQDERDANNAG